MSRRLFQRIARWALGTGWIVCSANAWCAATITRVDVFVDDLSPIAAGTEAKALAAEGALLFWNLDDLERFSAKLLGSNVPRELAAAKQRVAQRIAALTPEELAEFSRLATGQARAEGFNVKRLPAVVINEQHVYYGPRAVEEALRAFRGEASPSDPRPVPMPAAAPELEQAP